MSVTVLLITHGKIGQAILEAAQQTLGELPLSTHAISVEYRCPETLLTELHQHINMLDKDDDILILTDIFGATPCNLARQLPANQHLLIVSGLNLPMLLCVMNYCYLTLPELAQAAYEGGRQGVYRTPFLTGVAA